MSHSTRPPSSDIAHLTRMALRMLLAQHELAQSSDPAQQSIAPDIDDIQQLVAQPTWDVDDLLMGVRLVACHESLLWDEDPDVDTPVRAFAIDCEREQSPVPLTATHAASNTAAEQETDAGPSTDEPSCHRPAGPGRPSLPPAERARNKKISQAGWRTRNAVHVREYMRRYRLTRRQVALVMAVKEAADKLGQFEEVRGQLLRRYLDQPGEDLAAAIDAYGRTVAHARARLVHARIQLASLGNFDEATLAALGGLNFDA